MTYVRLVDQFEIEPGCVAELNRLRWGERESKRVPILLELPIAWLASRKAGLEYWLDVHDPVLRLARAALPPGAREIQ